MRKANQNHVDQILELYKLLIKSQQELEPFYFKEACQTNEFIKELMSDQKSDILIEADGNKINGFLVIREVESPDYPMFIKRKSAYILDLVVHPEQRNRGCAKKLLGAAKDWQKERELEYVELCVLEKNRNARELYESVGFENFSSQMILKN